MKGVIKKSSVAAFPLWFLQEQDGWVQRSENNLKDITGISVAYLRIHL